MHVVGGVKQRRNGFANQVLAVGHNILTRRQAVCFGGATVAIGFSSTLAGELPDTCSGSARLAFVRLTKRNEGNFLPSDMHPAAVTVGRYWMGWLKRQTVIGV